MPIKVRCDCGKTLNVPDKYVGKRIECPACGKPMVVSGGAGDDDLEIMPLEEFETGHDGRGPAVSRMPGPGKAPAARRGRRAPRGRKRGLTTRRGVPKEKPPPAPQAPGAPEQRCPTCKALLMEGVLVCTVCGLDLASGEHIIGAGRKRFQFRTILGPLAAVGMVAAIIYLWNEGYFSKWMAKPERGSRELPAAPVEAPAPAAPEEKPKTASPRAEQYTGGAVEGELILSDAGMRYMIRTPIVLKADAVLRVTSGVVLKGTSMGALRLHGGELSVEGAGDARVRVELAVSTGGGGARRIALERADFSAPVVLKEFGALEVRRCSFSAPVQIDPRDAGGNLEVLFEECAFLGPLKVRAGFVSDRLKITFRRCDFYDTVSCKGDAFAGMDLSGCYWGPESGLERPTSGLTLRIEPKLEEPASGVPRPEEKAAEVSAKDIVVNRADGYTFLCPAGWKRIGRRGLRGPSSLGSPRLEILTRPKEMVETRRKAIAEVRRASPVGLKASEIERVELTAGEAQTFELRYSTLGKRYVKTYHMLEGPKGKVLLVWTFRSETEDKLAGTRDEVTSSFAFLGGE